MDADTETLAAIFTSRIQTAKKTVAEVEADARKERTKTLHWLKSESDERGSFLWFCGEFDLDPGAVRRAMKEQDKGEKT